MSNSKISALTSATTPLAGTETVPVVQSSTTKQVSVANLTVGRPVSGTQFIPTGTPSSLWAIDFGSSTSNGNYVTIANGATYTLTAGSGLLCIIEESSSVGAVFAMCAYGGVSLISNPQLGYTTASGTPAKTNIFFSAGVYNIQNNSGASYNYWFATTRVRASS